jgi:hypothetical protein
MSEPGAHHTMTGGVSQSHHDRWPQRLKPWQVAVAIHTMAGGLSHHTMVGGIGQSHHGMWHQPLTQWQVVSAIHTRAGGLSQSHNSR